MRHLFAALAAFALVLAPACEDAAPRRAERAAPAHRLLLDAVEVPLGAEGGTLRKPVADALAALDIALAEEPALQALYVIKPDEGAKVKGAGHPPRFIWRDSATAADTWLISFRFGGQSGTGPRLLVPGRMPAEGVLDLFAATQRAWAPSAELWTAVVEHAKSDTIALILVGFSADAPTVPLSRGVVTISVSETR